MTTEDLTYSELRYRRLFEAAHDGILIVAPETRKILDANPFMTEVLGYTHEEFLGKELFEFGLLDDVAASRAAFHELQMNGYIRYEDLPLKTKDGRGVNVEFVSNIYQEGDQKVIQCNIRDISARKRAEKTRRESEERFRLFARAVTDVVRDWDLVTNELRWSERLLSEFGYDAYEIAPCIESWSSRIHPDERLIVLAGINEAINSTVESWSADYRFMHKGGSYADVHDRGFILRDTEGRGIRLVAGIRDITEQKQLEARIMRVQRMESIGTLAGGIAHDLNNVFTPIMMTVGLLKDELPAYARNLDIIDVSCRRAADLVRQVLNFARGLDGQRISIQIAPLVEDLMAMIVSTFPRNITIVNRVPSDLWPITGDPSLIHQILLNLAVNARDAMPDGGTLTISACNQNLDETETTGMILAAKSGKYVLLEARDTGSGIPPAVRERIFEPFFTTKPYGKGTGLGLSTVHAVVKGHGGFMNVESKMGKGTSFKVYLPTDQLRNSSPPTNHSKMEMKRGSGELILVIDDEISIREITLQILQAFGYRVLTANNGAEGFALYEEHVNEIALVLTDMMMPVMGGKATIRALMEINPSVKIILVTGLGSDEADDSISNGFEHETLSKPYSAETLVSLVGTVIGRPSVERQLSEK